MHIENDSNSTWASISLKMGENSKKWDSAGKKVVRSRMMFSLKLLILTQFTFCERPAIFGGEIIYLINISMPLNHPKVVLKS